MSTGGTAGAAGQLVIYPAPQGLQNTKNLAVSELYSVAINGQSTFVYRSMNRRPENSAVKEAHFAYFSFASQPVTVTVTKLTGAISSAKVLPTRLGITPQIAGNVSFVLDQPRKLMLQIDGDAKPLILFADAPDTNVPTGPNVTRFGPGFHDIGRNYPVKSNQTIYLDGGAVVKGTFGVNGPMQSNFTLRGRGIVYAGDYAWPGDDSTTYGNYGIFHQNVKDSRLEGIIALDSEYWNFGISNQNTAFENLKIIAWERNTDGIWLGPNSKAHDCFIMSDDDTLRPVSSPGYPDASQTLAEELVIWHGGYGRPLYVPVYKWNAPLVQNIIYRNIDFIRSQHSYWAQSYIPATTSGTRVKNILFENVNFEEIITPSGKAGQGLFFRWEVFAGSSITGVTFRNFRVPSTVGSMTGCSSRFGCWFGASATDAIRDITFDGFYVGGRKTTSLSDMGVQANANVFNVRFL